MIIKEYVGSLDKQVKNKLSKKEQTEENIENEETSEEADTENNIQD